MGISGYLPADKLINVRDKCECSSCCSSFSFNLESLPSIAAGRVVAVVVVASVAVR